MELKLLTWPLRGLRKLDDLLKSGHHKVADFLRQQPLFMLAEQIAIVVVAVVWLFECEDRAKERHYRAWELINSARGSPGDGGRIDALQDLNKDCVSLAAAPLENAYLAGINLEKGDLAGANFKNATLTGANFKGTSFGKKLITYQKEWIQICYLGICIPNTFGFKSNYTSSLDTKANFHKAILIQANFQNADLSDADLSCADLYKADFKDADLKNTDLRGANLSHAKIFPEQLETAKGDDRTMLPDGLARPAHWAKEENESEPCAQPDAAGSAPAAPGAPRSDK